jgi:DNA-binding beta-propeller fold protein YncE
MRLGIAATTLLVILSIAAAPIPVDNRIPATVTRTIAGPTAEPLVMPTDLAIDSTGHLYVADGVNDRIVRFTAQGAVDSVIHDLSRPVGVAIDSIGSLWIADTGNHRLIVRPADGSAQKIIDLPAAFDKPADPTGIAIRADGSRTYIADCGNHRILVRDNASGQITPLGQWGTSLGQFRWPFMLCMGDDNHVLITETLGARVQQLNAANHWGGQISQFGVALGDLYRPKGVTVDSKRRIFVGDSSMGVIQAFDPTGKVLGVLTDDTGQPLHFAHPMGMRFDSNGSLCIVELSANRVAVVSLKEPAVKK